MNRITQRRIASFPHYRNGRVVRVPSQPATTARSSSRAHRINVQPRGPRESLEVFLGNTAHRLGIIEPAKDIAVTDHPGAVVGNGIVVPEDGVGGLDLVFHGTRTEIRVHQADVCPDLSLGTQPQTVPSRVFSVQLYQGCVPRVVLMNEDMRTDVHYRPRVLRFVP